MFLTLNGLRSQPGPGALRDQEEMVDGIARRLRGKEDLAALLRTLT